MKVKKFEKQLFPQDIGMSPRFVAHRFMRSIFKYGEENVDKSIYFKKAREMLTTAGFLFALSEADGKIYWVLPEHDNETPDTYGIYHIPSRKYQGSLDKIRMNFEVVDWEKHYNFSLSELVKTKLKEKAYPPYYNLLIYVSKEGRRQTLTKDISEIQKYKPKIRSVWVVGSLKDEVEKDQFNIINLWPGKKQRGFRIEFSFSDFLLKKKHPGDIMEFHRGTSGERFLSNQYRLDYPTSPF